MALGMLVLLAVPEALAAGRKAQQQEYRRALRETAALESRLLPQDFCPTDWRALTGALDRLGAAVGSDPENFAVYLRSYKGVRDWVVPDCRHRTEKRLAERLAEQQRVADAVRAGLEQGVLVEIPALSRLLAESLRQADAVASGTWGDPLELQRSIDATRLRLEQEATDPCGRDFALAEHAKATGRPSLARSRYEEILRRSCFGTEHVEAARWALDRLPPEPEPVEIAAAVPQQADPPVRHGPADLGPTAPASSTTRPGLPDSAIAMTLWQSAWGDFSNLEVLGDFVRRNRITEVYLNPGLAITEKADSRAYARMKTLVEKLRGFGIREISFLYAELRYDIARYAEFLELHSDLGIRTLADDSELTDLFRDRFEHNRAAVNEHDLEYAAFVTVETLGNSGVSDETRYWALDRVDRPILMSYFGCSLAEQQKWLEKYLAHADQQGREQAVRIAILLGSKKAGREVSCEQALDEQGLQRFLKELHDWAASHPSYGGLVLENNRPLPRYDVAPSSPW